MEKIHELRGGGVRGLPLLIVLSKCPTKTSRRGTGRNKLNNNKRRITLLNVPVLYSVNNLKFLNKKV